MPTRNELYERPRPFPVSASQMQAWAAQYGCQTSEVLAAVCLIYDPDHPARPLFDLVGKDVTMFVAINIVTDWDFIDFMGEEIDISYEIRYYVTVKRDRSQTGWLCGPFDTHDEAKAAVADARAVAEEIDPWTAFDAFGTSSLTQPAGKAFPVGVLNEKLNLKPTEKNHESVI